MPLQSIFKRHPADGLLITAILALGATQVAMEGVTGNALFNTLVAVVCAGVIKRYAVRFGGMGFSAWRRDNTWLVFLTILFCGACTAFLVYAALAGYIGPVATLAGLLLGNFIVVAWLLLTEMAKTALRSLWDKKNG